MQAPFIAAIMVHVPSVSEATAWYERVFTNAVRSSTIEPTFEYLLVGQTRLELVPADSKVSSGASGSVVYWQFAEFEEALLRFQEAGAKLYRGPMPIESGQVMCQVQDPWGNCIGLRGPSKSKSGRAAP